MLFGGMMAQRKWAKGKQSAGIKRQCGCEWAYRLKLDADKDLQTCTTFSFGQAEPATKGLTCCTNINCATTCKLLFDCMKRTIPTPIPQSHVLALRWAIFPSLYHPPSRYRPSLDKCSFNATCYGLYNRATSVIAVVGFVLFMLHS